MLVSPVLLAESFYSITMGNIVSATITTGGVLVALVKLGRERKQEWQGLIKEQTVMHTENRLRLDALIKFQGNQEELNRKRDHQVNELRSQTAMLTEITKGFDRRLHMLEDRRTRE